MTELELLNRIKKNPAEFSELFNLYYKPIFGYILRRTGNFDDTSDIAAETFLKAFRHISRFSYKGISLKVWLYRIATNEVNQYFRNKQKNTLLFQRLDFENKEIFQGYLQDDRLILEKELQSNTRFLFILESLKTLSLKYQEVIALKYFEERSNKEISDILGIKEGTLKSRVSRGLEKLRKKCNALKI